MRRTLGWIGLGLFAVLAWQVVPGNSAPPVNQVREFMRKKLVHSQKVLEGLTVDDLPMVAKHAQELSLLSQAAQWQVLQTPDYLQQSTDFRRAADTLAAAAGKGNLDGATLAYMEVTMKCVSCHKYVRGVRIAKR
jgi:cytochrome c556